eukprot:XP_016665143.1 PREDICTED: uncharacterized protein LOC107885896 [Acyrthosiphon pisum]
MTSLAFNVKKRRGELSKEERPKHREQKYRPEWELKPSFKDWLRKVEGDNMKAKCIKCNTTFVSELVVIKNHALDHIVDVLKDIFDDSEICQKIQLKRTKATNVIKNVISPFAKQLLAKKLMMSKFSVMIDESTDIGCESTWFHDDEEQRIVSRFWSLVQVYDKKNIDKINEGATANNLFNACIQTFEEYKIPFTNIIGFGSDGCNSMFAVRNSVASRMENVFPGIFLMKCICHSLHLVRSEACKELPKRCEDLARQIHSYFSQSSKRQSQFNQFQVFLKVKEHKILHPSATRWLSMFSVVSRIVEQWDALKLYFNDQWLSEKLLSSKTIYDQLNDPFTKAFYLFLEWVLPNCLSPKVTLSTIKRQTWPSLLTIMNKVPRIVDKNNTNLMQAIDDQWRTLPLNIPQNVNQDMDTGTFWNNMYVSNDLDDSGFKELAKFALTNKNKVSYIVQWQ